MSFVPGKPIVQHQVSSETKGHSQSEADTEDEDTFDGIFIKKSESQQR